jgi:hypothetical protein
MKGATEVQDRDDIISRILVAVADVRGQHRQLLRVRGTILRLCGVSLPTAGGMFVSAVLLKEVLRTVCGVPTT